ncbi:MAG: sigma-70 family RNA polymerase sigma factor [Planctomycetes bacterium]|nr:sigma-70 family RNA polymerase sigma factor [Planctomycetota bacterium]
MQGPAGTEELIERAKAGDATALAHLFEGYRARLRKLVDLRLDRRLAGRVDPSDVLQEAFIDLAQKLPTYDRRRDLQFFLWLRLVTGERLAEIHRRHLGTKKRDAALEVSLYRGSMPTAESVTLAHSLFGRFSSPSHGAMRAEIQIQLQDVLNAMEPIDREVLVLRHFEELTNDEAAAVLGLKKTAASNRYMRALGRLREALVRMPGFLQ